MVDPYKGIGRNDPCPCGSGKKFKKCCLNSQSASEPPAGTFRVAQERDAARSALDLEDGAITTYDPFVEPASAQWLSLDEQERIDLILEYHRRAKIRLPRAEAHAGFHAIVESQIADATLPVRGVAQRLMSEGLDRHQAIHAIGSVLAGCMHDIMQGVRGDSMQLPPDPNQVYFAELSVLTAKDWLKSG